jgi:hypothetical protein
MKKEDRKCRVVNDIFAQCDACKMWVRLHKADELGNRGIPLVGHTNPITNLVKMYICFKCFEEFEQIFLDENFNGDTEEEEELERYKVYSTETNKKAFEAQQYITSE